MTALFAPMLCSPIDDAAAAAFLDDRERDDAWVFEPKADGHRKLTHVVDGEVIPLNRAGDRTTLPLPMIRVLSEQRVDFTLDGELIGSGRHRTLWVFDLPYFAGLIEPATPWCQRHAALETLHEQLVLEAGGIRLLPVSRTPAEKAGLRRAVRERGGEGIVVKHVDGAYAPGRRTTGASKVKYRKAVDCLVTGLGVDGHDNIALSLYDTDGRRVDVGEVTAQAGDGPLIKQRYQAGDREMVVEVTCLYATDSDRIYQPTRPILRTDKRAAECGLAQLGAIRVNRAVIDDIAQTLPV